MSHPQSWPQADRLFLKQYVSRHASVDFAILYSVEGEYDFSFVPDNGQPSRAGGIEMLERLVQEGWLVD